MHANVQKSLLCALLLGAGFLLPDTSAQAQDTAALTARLQQTAAESTLDQPGTQPWHLKLDLQLFDAKGAPTEVGSVEEWWADSQNYRLSYVSPSFNGTELHVDDKVYRTTSAGFEPALFDDMLEQVLHPLRYADNMTSGKPDLRKQSFGKVDLECIMLDQHIANVPFPPLGLFPTYCLDPGKPSLRISVETGSLIFVRSRVGHFLGHAVPLDLMAQDGAIKLATAHISALSTMKPEALDRMPGADLALVGNDIARIGAGIVAGNILDKISPVYPQRAKENHVSGTVLLHAIIGRDGRVRSLRIVSTPDSDLAIASLVAVRQWTYKPYLLNGLPTEVDTTITVHFSFG